MDPEWSGWHWSEHSCCLKTNSVFTYSVRSSKYEQNPTVGSKKPVPQEGASPADSQVHQGLVVVFCWAAAVPAALALTLPPLIKGMDYPTHCWKYHGGDFFLILVPLSSPHILRPGSLKSSHCYVSSTSYSLDLPTQEGCSHTGPMVWTFQDVESLYFGLQVSESKLKSSTGAIYS